MASTIESKHGFPNPRQGRMSDFDGISQMSSTMRFGTGLRPTKNAWARSENIWGTTNRPNLYTDERTDCERKNGDHCPDSDVSVDLQFSRDKAGSKSLISTSNSESWHGRSHVPWRTTLHTTSPIVFRSGENEFLPKGRSDVDGIQNHTNLSTNGNVANLQFTSKGKNSIPPANGRSQEVVSYVPAKITHSAASSDSFGGYSGNHIDINSRQQVSSISFGVNKSALAVQRHCQHIDVDEELLAIRPDMITRHRDLGTLAELHDRSYDPPSRYKESSNFSNSKVDFHAHTSSGLSSSSHFSPNALYDFPATLETVQAQLTAEFGQMALQREHTSSDGQFSFQDPDIKYRSSYNEQSKFRSVIPAPHLRYTPEGYSFRGHLSHFQDIVPDYGHQVLPQYCGNSSFGDTESISPSASESRQSLNSPFYSTSITPPTGSESVRSMSGSALSSRASNGQGAIADRNSRISQSYYEQHCISSNPPQPRLRHPQQYDSQTNIGTLRLNPLANPYAMPTCGISPAPFQPRFSNRDHGSSHVIRSALLEDFRNNHKSTKKYELKDIFDHVVEFSGDQHGSRFIQQKLETANSDEKDQIFAEIQPNLLQLMTDVFGNYVIQKLFEHGNQSQKKVLANQMKGHVMTLSTQMYGCRVVQKALEHVLTDQQASLVKELECHVLRCVKDQNGNHVIQKAIERVPAQYIKFIIDAFTDQVQRLATHTYGCRVIQRMLEHCEEPARQSILQEIHACVSTLITDQYGNYVIQHIIENGGEQDKARIVAMVLSQLLVFSKHKFASNVVEKSIEFAEDGQRAEILRQLTQPNDSGESPVLGLMRDQYGNYVLQKVLGQLTGAGRETLVNQIKPQLMQLKSFSYGKQILAIEKLIVESDNETNLSGSSQSSTLPSTNTSMVEGPITPLHPHAKKPSPS